tara:strand:- start:15887 stop:16657 length:771 start_codon:yes stop_codon:yes gene_type:complete
MKKLTPLIFYVLLIVASCKVSKSSADITNKSINGRGEGNIRILIVTGGHGFDRPAFFEMFNSMKNIEWVESVQPEAQKMFGEETINDYDILVFYDMYEPIQEEEKIAFLKLLEKGKPILFLHHALVSHQNWPEYRKILGGKYYEERLLQEKPNHPYSNYLHDTDVDIKILQKDHPITKGLSDFKVNDEVYGNTEVLPGVVPILGTTHPNSTYTIGWEHKYANSKIVFLQPGHGASIFADDNYRRLLYQAIEYLMKK